MFREPALKRCQIKGPGRQGAEVRKERENGEKQRKTEVLETKNHGFAKEQSGLGKDLGLQHISSRKH